MDLLIKYTKDKAYSDRIINTSYTQCIQNNIIPVFPTFIDLIFSVFDHHYSMVENKDKKLYIKQRVLEIATELDEDRLDKYDKFNYLKCMNSTLIQQGLQSMKSISALLYLGDYYSISFHIFMETSGIRVKTSDKTRKEFKILYTNDCKWKELNLESENFKDGTFEDLGLCFTLDVTTKDIYKKYLKPISNYKSAELIEIAIEMNIPIEKNGKKKVKKELYEDINFYQLNLK